MKKIGEIKGIPVVEGNINEVTKNQIHYKEDSGSIQLSKRGNDNKLNSVTGSSSGGGEGVKEYYYKIKDEFLNNIHNINVTGIPFLDMLHSVIGIDAIICAIYIDDGEWHSIGNSELDGNFVVLNKIKTTSYFKIIDSNIYLGLGYQDDHTITYDSIISRIGNIENRIIKAAHLFGDEETAMRFLEMTNQIIQEITKEEYESMITYKPE